MAAIALEDSLSKGHDDESWPKTLPESGLSEKTKVNGKFVVAEMDFRWAGFC